MNQGGKKLRMLYAQGHETLGDIQIPILIEGGFEVIRPFAHILYRGLWQTPVREIDNINSTTNKLLEQNYTLDKEIVSKIRKIDILGFSKLPFTIDSEKKFDVNISRNPDLTDEEKALINEYIDVISIMPLPYHAAKILEWFKGVVILNLYNIESGITNTELHQDTRNTWFEGLKKHSDRLITNFLYQSSLEAENPDIMPGNKTVLGAAINTNIRNIVFGLKWKADEKIKGISTNISYIPSPFSIQLYDVFIQHFKELNYKIYGKNQEYDNNKNIVTYIKERKEFLEGILNSRVFINPSLTDIHQRYTALEAIAMGVPTLFLKNSVIGYLASKTLTGREAENAGMCNTWKEMKARAVTCIKDIKYAKNLAIDNQIILDKLFTKDILLEQAKNLFEIIYKTLLQKEELKSSLQFELIDKYFDNNDAKKETRILWAFNHETLRKEELPLFWKAGFEVIPIKIIESLRRYEGERYDDETRVDYPKWRENCNLPFEITEKIRNINLLSSPHHSGNITKEDIEILNKYIGIIYVPASIEVCVTLLKKGYNGILLFRYVGYYLDGVNGTNHIGPKDSEIRQLSVYPNIIYCPGLHSLSRYEDKRIAVKEKTAYIGYLTAQKECLKFRWKAEKSEPCLGIVLSMATTHLWHYYCNFIKNFGHLPYKIFGKNTKEEMGERGVIDENIVGQMKQAGSVYEGMCKQRVYIEPGMVPHHCHYTPVEAIAMHIPVIFHWQSGLATEAMVKFSAAQLYEMGMCLSWDEMTVMAEKCLKDVRFAIELSNKQRPLENIVTREEIVEEMMAFREQIPSILKKIAIFNKFSFMFFKKYQINLTLTYYHIVRYIFKMDKQKKKMLFRSLIDTGYKIKKKRSSSIAILRFALKQTREVQEQMLKQIKHLYKYY